MFLQCRCRNRLSSMRALVSLSIFLLSRGCSWLSAEFVRKEKDPWLMTNDYARPTSLGNGAGIRTTPKAAQRQTVPEGVTVHHTIVLCIGDDPELLKSELVSVIATFPDADRIILVANGFRVPALQTAELQALIPPNIGPSVHLKILVDIVSPQRPLAFVWNTLPLGAKIVVFCIGPCENYFSHYKRVIWSYGGVFEGPHIAFVSECISWAEVNGLHPPHPPYPVLIMVDTAIVDHFGVPKEGDASLKESAAYVGRRPRRGIADVDKERPAGVSSNKPTFEREAPAHFKVLIVLEGSTDTTTALVFADIADTVHDGLSELGHTTKTVYCVNLATDNCFDEAEHLIVLAPHNLASYFTLEGKLAVLEGNMLPSDAVLYNFEHVHHPSTRASPPEPHARQDRSLVSDSTIAIYAKYTLWEYSEQNADNLLSMGITSELVPLGFSPRFERNSPMIQQAECQGRDESLYDTECIDVLFVGTATPVRLATIGRIRDAGVPVVYPNAAGMGIFGSALDEVTMRSKIVLSLKAFNSTACRLDNIDASCEEGEWKIARIIRLLANSRFVIAEMSGTASERAELFGGVVFTTAEQIAETCLYYLDHPHERTAIAGRGRRIIEGRVEAEILRKPVHKILRKARQSKSM